MIKLTFKFPKVKKGGTGSGHFGHDGRPGKVGGSVPNMTSSQYANSLSVEDRKIVRRYTGGDFTYMNRHLRTGHKTSDSIKNKISGLKRIIQEAPPFRESMTLARHTTVDMSGYNVGDIFTEKGFSSTSTNPYKHRMNSNYFFINVKPHQRGLFVEDIGGHKSEREVILNPSRFKITSVTPFVSDTGVSGYSVYTMDLLDE